MFLAAIRADFVDLLLFLLGLKATVGGPCLRLLLRDSFLYLSVIFFEAIIAFLFSLTSSRFKLSTFIVSA